LTNQALYTSLDGVKRCLDYEVVGVKPSSRLRIIY